jgi:hypothetical protein
MRYYQQHLWRRGGIRVLHAEDVNEAQCGFVRLFIPGAGRSREVGRVSQWTAVGAKYNCCHSAV